VDRGSAPAPPLGHLFGYTVLAAHTALVMHTVPGGGQSRQMLVNLANGVIAPATLRWPEQRQRKSLSC